MEALAKWVGKIPSDVVRDMADVAPMLSVLGYDPYANPPNYGNPDSFVRENTNKVSRRSLKRLTKNSKFLFYHIQVMKNPKLWDIKAKQLLNRDEDEEDNQDTQDDGADNHNSKNEEDNDRA